MSELVIGTIALGELGTNGYFIYKDGSSECLFVDPGDSGREVVEHLQKKGLTIKAILLTHAHYDHVLGVAAMKEACGAPIYACIEEKPAMESSSINLSYTTRTPVTVEVDNYLKDGDEEEIAGLKFRLIHTPGHTKGGCCYFFEGDNALMCGDTLFADSVGRTDFPGGSMREIVSSIKEKLFTLPDETICYPGHGPATTIEYEKKYNPFCR